MSFSNIFWKDKGNIEKTCADTNSQLKKFCRQKSIKLSNDNIKEEHLGIKKLYLNRIGNSVFAKNLLNFIERHWGFSTLRDPYFEIENVCNTSNTIVSNAISTLQHISVSNVNRLILGHLDINSLRNEFDFTCE